MEGVHDIAYLRGISQMLHRADAGVPDVGQLEQAGRLLFVPYGGSDPRPWVTRLAALGLPELHLYDREFPPVTAQRQAAVDAVNQRPGCRAFLTGLPTMESYLHPAAIYKAGGIEVRLTRHEDAVEVVARTKYERRHGGHTWSHLPARSRKRLRDQAKHWLNTAAVGHMTIQLLAERDPAGDIRRWLGAGVELGGWAG